MSKDQIYKHMASNKLAERIEQYANAFEWRERGENDTIAVLNDDVAPEGLRDAVQKAHGDRFPDDFVYSNFLGILEKLQEYTIESLDDVDDHRSEIVDSLVDVYTHDLTAWLHSSVENVHYITQALQESECADGFQLLMVAQYYAIDEVFAEVYALLSGDNS